MLREALESSEEQFAHHHTPLGSGAGEARGDDCGASMRGGGGGDFARHNQFGSDLSSRSKIRDAHLPHSRANNLLRVRGRAPLGSESHHEPARPTPSPADSAGSKERETAATTGVAKPLEKDPSVDGPSFDEPVRERPESNARVPQGSFHGPTCSRRSACILSSVQGLSRSRAASASPPALPDAADDEAAAAPGGGAVESRGGRMPRMLGELSPLDLLHKLHETEELLQARELQVGALKAMKKREEQTKLLERTARLSLSRHLDGWRRVTVEARASRALARKDEQIQLLASRLRQMASAMADPTDPEAAAQAAAAAAEAMDSIAFLPLASNGTSEGPSGGAMGRWRARGHSMLHGSGRSGGSGSQSAEASGGDSKSKSPPRRGQISANPLSDGMVLFERGGHSAHGDSSSGGHSEGRGGRVSASAASGSGVSGAASSSNSGATGATVYGSEATVMQGRIRTRRTLATPRLL